MQTAQPLVPRARCAVQKGVVCCWQPAQPLTKSAVLKLSNCQYESECFGSTPPGCLSKEHPEPDQNNNSLKHSRNSQKQLARSTVSVRHGCRCCSTGVPFIAHVCKLWQLESGVQDRPVMSCVTQQVRQQKHNDSCELRPHGL